MDDGLKQEHNFPTPLLHVTFLLQQSADNLLDSSIGAGLSAMRVMSALHDRLPRSQQDVASRLGQTESSISRQLKLMKKQGLVTITKNNKDRRQRDVMLTQKGQSKLKQGLKLLDGQQKRALTGLKKTDQKEFSAYMKRIIRNL